MISHDNQPCARGSAAEPREVLRRSRSNIPSRVFVVVLAAAAMTTAAIYDRPHENNAKVAPSTQFLRYGASRNDTNGGVTDASKLSGLTSRTVSAYTELVTRRGQSHSDALSAEFFTASYTSTSTTTSTREGILDRDPLRTSRGSAAEPRAHG